MSVSSMQTASLLTASQSELSTYLFLLDFFMLLMRGVKCAVAGSFSGNMCFLLCQLE